MMMGTTVFGDVLPTNTPIAVTPESDDVTEDDIAIARGAITVISDPVTYESTEEGHDALQREEVYAIVEIPSNIAGADESAHQTFTLIVDGSIVPYKEPSEFMVNLLNFYLDRNLDQSVTVEHEVVGSENTLSEYLVPIGMIMTLLIFSFAYLPYHLANERQVLKRLRVESSLEKVIATKITFFSLLMLLPFIIFSLVSRYMDYGISSISLPLVGVLLLTFIYLCAISTSVMFFTNFSTTGQFLNIIIFIGHIVFGSMMYPAGFFSQLHREIARTIPLHYSTIIVRSEVLKDVQISLFYDWIGNLILFTLLTIVMLQVSIKYYEYKQ